ncbi:MAG: pyridoxine 5'-phosphate synthase [Deltaproteobacteria bacterium]|nr:pyridoxine 5'-phosphate synthase [Deltaproteobacteria bacterium]
MPGGGVYYMWRSCLLFIKIDKIATLTETRTGNGPDLIERALICEKSGADGVTVHLREDRQHIQDRDVFALKEAIHGQFNLEICLSDEMMDIARKVNPNQVTIVREKAGEKAGYRESDILKNKKRITDVVKPFHDRNTLVCLCVEPDAETIALSKACGADFIEIHTGRYCSAVRQADMDRELEKIYGAAKHAAKAGIKVSAGHGLNYQNTLPVLNARALEQVTIGRSIFSRAVFVGLSKAVEEMLDIVV